MADLHPGILFLILVAAVPLQFYLSPSATSHVKFRLQRLTDSVFSLASRFGLRLPGVDNRQLPADKTEDTVAGILAVKEVEKAKQDEKYYGTSKLVRDRSPAVQFRIGDVVKHNILGYRGVVIGWDSTTQAPKEFLDKMYAMKKDWSFLTQPTFGVLIDGRDKLTPSLGYVPQENLELSSGRINHGMVINYMDKYDDAKQRYRPRPWLQRIYPDD